MKNYIKIINRKLRNLPLLLLAMALLSSCKEGEEEPMLYFEEPEVIVEAAAGSVSVILRSDTQWKINTTDDWFSYNISSGASSASIVFNFGNNDTGAVRSKKIDAITLDGSVSASFVFKQLPSGPAISLDPTSITVESDAATHEIGFTTNLSHDHIVVDITYGDDEGAGWITATAFAEDKFKFTVTQNTSGENKRVALINLSYMDEFGRPAEAALAITQMFIMDPAYSVERTINQAKELGAGDVADNIYIKGIVVACGNGADHNFKSKRYIIQDASGQSFVFESEAELSLAIKDEIKLWLLGVALEEKTEAGFTFLTGQKISPINILEKTPGQNLTVPQLYMDELNDAHLNTLVTLKDVEVAIPHGTWSNYNAYYVSGAGSDMKLVRFHPTGLRDVRGNFMYANINTEWKYAYTSTGGDSAKLPQGSGTITGIVVRETNSNMGDIGQYQIRPQSIDGIGIASARTSGFSGLLVEWDCERPASYEGMANIPASGGDQAAGATLFKSNATKLTTSNTAGNIYFINDYRNGGNSTATGTANAQVWGTDVWWIIKDINTLGINGALSLQIESNVNPENGPKFFVAEYSLDGSTWKAVPGGNYELRGHTTSAYKNEENYSPGFKCYNFSLPAELNNQPAIQIRLRCAGTESVNRTTTTIQKGSTNRLAHVSIKYNK